MTTTIDPLDLAPPGPAGPRRRRRAGAEGLAAIPAAVRANDQNAASRSPSLMLIMLLATLGAVAYSTFLLDPAHRGDPLPYALVILAEVILLG